MIQGEALFRVKHFVPPEVLCCKDGDVLAEISGVHQISWVVSLVVLLQHSVNSGTSCQFYL